MLNNINHLFQEIYLFIDNYFQYYLYIEVSLTSEFCKHTLNLEAGAPEVPYAAEPQGSRSR